MNTTTNIQKTKRPEQKKRRQISPVFVTFLIVGVITVGALLTKPTNQTAEMASMESNQVQSVVMYAPTNDVKCNISTQEYTMLYNILCNVAQEESKVAKEAIVQSICTRSAMWKVTVKDVIDVYQYNDATSYDVPPSVEADVRNALNEALMDGHLAVNANISYFSIGEPSSLPGDVEEIIKIGNVIFYGDPNQ